MKEESAKTIHQIKKLVNEEPLESKKKYLRVKHAVDDYGLSRTKLVKVARDAGALYKIGGTVLIGKEKFEEYIESFGIPAEDEWGRY